MRVTRSDVTMTHMFPSGGWEASAIVSGYRVARTYYGYSKREALALFVAEVN